MLGRMFVGDETARLEAVKAEANTPAMQGIIFNICVFPLTNIS